MLRRLDQLGNDQRGVPCCGDGICTDKITESTQRALAMGQRDPRRRRCIAAEDAHGTAWRTPLGDAGHPEVVPEVLCPTPTA